MPRQIWKGKLKSKEGDNLNNVIVTQLAGPSLKDYFVISNNYFSLETIFMIGLELVSFSQNFIEIPLFFTDFS